MIEEFTYRAYEELLYDILNAGYEIANYHNYVQEDNPCILRHDIDFSLESAANMAKLEYDMQQGIKATYFILLRTPFYNVYSREARKIIDTILKLGHEIGLHFDETYYDGISADYIVKEANMLSEAVGHRISTVSMHRPSNAMLKSELRIDGIVNSYSREFFNEFIYISDSRCVWHKDVSNIVKLKQYEKLHILVHPIWYTDSVESTAQKLVRFCNNQAIVTYYNLNKNIKNMEEFIKIEDIV